MNVRRHVFGGIVFALLAANLIVGVTPLVAQQVTPPANSRSGSSLPGVYLVFPFENAGASPRLDWIGEGLEELTIQRLSAAGQQVYSHARRLNELDRYGLPPSAKFSRATMLHVAEDLDADYVVYGSFVSDGKSLTVDSHMVRVNPVAMLPPIRESGTLDAFMDLHTRLVWQILSEIDRAYPLSLAEFTKSQRALRLDAFEHYIRGLLANDDEARLRELREATRLEPEWPDPDFALGQTYFARNDCNSAFTWFARVPKNHERSAEAVFATGVCRLRLNQPDRAEEVFTTLLEAMHHTEKASGDAGGQIAGADFPEVLNNRGVARVRQGKTAEAKADFLRANELDPDEDDYPVNLGLVALRGSDYTDAAGYFREAVARQPDNPEDRALLVESLEKSGKKEDAEKERQAAAETLGANSLPVIRVDAKSDALARLDRVKVELDTSALRMEIGAVDAAPAAAAESAVPENAAGYIRHGRQELLAGRVDSAEREFHAAVALDAREPSAHRELGEIYRRRGKLDDAVNELQASLAARDSAVVRTLLARIYLEQKKSDLARAQLEQAIKLAPNFAEAKQLLERLRKGNPAGGAH
jgi:tetratricopeptide (TPR) repeat protein/TolB-like protein